MDQQDNISILGPRDDGTYVVEFRTAEGKKLAITVPSTKAAVLKHFQAATAELHIPIPDEGAMIGIEVPTFTASAQALSSASCLGPVHARTELLNITVECRGGADLLGLRQFLKS